MVISLPYSLLCDETWAVFLARFGAGADKAFDYSTSLSMDHNQVLHSYLANMA